MSTEARRSSIASIDVEGVDNPYSVWTCRLTRQERSIGLGVIVQLDSEDKQLQSLLPCLGKKLSQQKVDLQTNYALLTCHSNLDVEDGAESKHFDLKGVQACVGPVRDTVFRKIALEDCVSCAVSCCGPNSMLMLSSSVPAAYTLLPHTNGRCPIDYDFVILFLNEQFEPGETTLPPVVNVSECLNLDSLQKHLACQSVAQPWSRNSGAVGDFYLCSRQTAGLNMVKVKVPYSKERREAKRFCDEIDWYKKHQRLKCSLDSQSFNGAPIICWHEGTGNLVGICSTGDQVVTLYGICQLLAGGPVPLFAAMKHPSPRTLSPFRWSHHILLHLDADADADANTVTQKGYLLEMFHLLVEKVEGSALANLLIADTMDVSMTAMDILTKILKKFAGAKEVEEVIKESHIFEPTNEDIDEVKACIVRVCKRLQFFMQHFSSVQRGTNPEKILESVFHCTETMLYWGLQYPDVDECLLSNESVEFAAKAAENYRDSGSINNSFKRIRQCHDRMVEQDLVRMRRKIAEQQKELQEKEQELKKRKSEDSGEWRNVQSEAEEELGHDHKQQTSAAGNPILSKSPTIRMLIILRGPGGEKVEIIASVSRKWKNIGLLLDFDTTGQYLDTIEITDKDPSSCCQAIFQHWLKGNGVEQTWGKLIEILRDCKQGTLADNVEKVLMARESLT